jgi:hypothetical protein
MFERAAGSGVGHKQRIGSQVEAPTLAMEHALHTRTAILEAVDWASQATEVLDDTQGAGALSAQVARGALFSSCKRQ